MKKLLFILFIAVINITSKAQFDLEWFKTLKNTQTLNNTKGLEFKIIESGKNNDIYIAGWFNGTMDFDPSPVNYFLTPEFNSSGFIAKYNSLGNLIWVKKINDLTGNGYVEIIDLILDDNDNIYMTGYLTAMTGSIVDFDPSQNNYYDTISSNNRFKLFVAKYNSNGDFIWEKNIGNQYDSKGMKIFLCSTNYLIIGGTINTSLPILIKFNINGNFIEQKSFTGGDIFGSLFVSSTGDIYITGRGTNIDMDLGNSTSILNGNSIVFVGKYSSTFQLIWAKKINTNVVQTCLTVDDLGNVFTAGNTFIINSRIICKLDNNGNLNWLYSYGNCAPTSIDNISINCSGNLLISGIYDYSCNNFNLLGGTNSIQSQGTNLNINSNNNFFIACYNAIDCSLIWVKGLQGSNWPTSTFDNNSELKRSRYINIKKTNNFYVTSNFIGATDLDPNASSVILNSSTTNYNDIFFAKYSGCNSIGLPKNENNTLPNLFPNPTNGTFTVSNLKPNSVIEILDITGRIVFKTQTKNENITIQLNDVEKGIYVYKIIDKQGFVQSGKVVVE